MQKHAKPDDEEIFKDHDLINCPDTALCITPDMTLSNSGEYEIECKTRGSSSRNNLRLFRGIRIRFRDIIVGGL
jgi:hypothetical protein